MDQMEESTLAEWFWMLNTSGKTYKWIYFTFHQLDHWNPFYTAESYHALNLQTRRKTILRVCFALVGNHYNGSWKWWFTWKPPFPGLSQLETNFQTKGIRRSWWKCAVQWMLMSWICSCELSFGILTSEHSLWYCKHSPTAKPTCVKEDSGTDGAVLKHCVCGLDVLKVTVFKQWVLKLYRLQLYMDKPMGMWLDKTQTNKENMDSHFYCCCRKEPKWTEWAQ